MLNHKLFLALVMIALMSFCKELFAQPANDAVCSAINLTVNGVANCYSTLNATTASDPSYSCGTPAATVWFKFTAPGSGSVTISTDKTGTNFNTVLALFSAASCSGTFTEVGCNDDGNQNVVANSSDLVLNCLTPFEVYYVMVDGAGGATGMVCISITNNGGWALGADFSCGFGSNSPGLPIIQVNGNVSCFTNKCAGTDSGEPTGASWSDGPEKSIWMLFIAPSSGSVLIRADNPGTTLNNQIAVYGTACPYFLANQKASDEGSGSLPGTSKLEVCGLTSGSSYWIQVDGVAADTGTVCISVSNLSAGNLAPGPDELCNATSLSTGGMVASYNNICATSGVEPSGSNWKAPGIAEKTTWHKFVAPANGKVTISTDHTQTNFDTQIAVYSSSDGTCNGTLTEVGSDDDSGTGLTSQLSLSCLNSGSTYFIQIDGFSADSGDYGISVVNDSGSVGAVNDSICNAVVIGVGSGTSSFSNLCADTEINEPSPSCFTVENSVYFSFTPPASGNATITFSNTSFPLEVVVFRVWDDVCTDTIQLLEVACDATTLTNPSLNLSCLDPYSDYLILVDGAAGAAGTFDLAISGNAGGSLPPDNACDGVFVQVPLDNTISVFTNSCASTQSGEPAPPAGTNGSSPCTSSDGWCDTEPSSIQKTIWLTFKPSASGQATISTDNDSTDFDTQLAVWAVGNCSDFSSYSLLGANDNCPGGCAGGNTLASTVSVCVDSGKIYFIQLDGYNGASGKAGITGFIIPVNAFAGNDTIVCADEDIVLQASGGVQYLWSNGATTALVTVHPLVITTFTVTVTDANGCSASDAVKVNVDYAFPTANAGADTFTCANTPITLMASGGVTYRWSNGATTASNTVSPAITTGYSVSVYNANGCKDVDAVNVTVNQLPPANAGNDTTICIGSSANLHASGGVSYAWSTGATTATTQVTPISDSTFSVTVTGANGCSKSDNILVHVAFPPLVDIGNDTAVCSGASLPLGVSNVGTYLWSTGETGSAISPTMVNDSTFGITITSAAGCSATDNIHITVNPLPVANAGPDTAICSGNMLTLIGIGGALYQWSTGSTFDSTIVSPLMNTTYFLTVTDGNGCSGKDSVTVTVNSNPVAVAGNDTLICKGASAALFASGGINYVWSNGATTPVITVSPVSDMNFSVTVIDAQGCFDSENVLVSVSNSLFLSAGGDTGICAGSSVVLSAIGSPGSYLWNTAETSSSISVSPTGTTVYEVTLTDSIGCFTSDSVTVNVFPLPDPQLNDDTTCLGDSATLMALNGTTFIWSTGATTGMIQVAPANTALYSVTVLDGNGCIDSDSAWVTIHIPPQVSLTLDTIYCFNAGTRVLTGGNPAGGIYSGNGVTGNVFDPQAAGLGTHWITYTVGPDSNNCFNSAQFLVTVDLCTGIGTPDLSKRPVVYPNPFSHSFRIEIDANKDGPVHIRVLDIIGKTVMEKDEKAVSGISSLQINTEDWKMGIYFLEITLDEQVYPVKLSRFN